MNTKDYLITHNIKPSMQRIAIMDYLINHKTHPTADEIFVDLNKLYPTLSKTTIYNTLKLFTENGAVLTLNIDEKNVRFDGDTSNHAHMQCTLCGKVYDLKIISDAEIEVANHEIVETQIIMKGYCEKCRNINNN